MDEHDLGTPFAGHFLYEPKERLTFGFVDFMKPCGWTPMQDDRDTVFDQPNPCVRAFARRFKDTAFASEPVFRVDFLIRLKNDTGEGAYLVSMTSQQLEQSPTDAC